MLVCRPASLLRQPRRFGSHWRPRHRRGRDWHL